MVLGGKDYYPVFICDITVQECASCYAATLISSGINLLGMVDGFATTTPLFFSPLHLQMGHLLIL